MSSLSPPSNLTPSTPEASSALAQSRGAAEVPAPGAPSPLPASAAVAPVEIGPRVARAAEVAAYERKHGDPIFRPVRIYALDPDASRLEGAVTLVNVPYEELKPGPRGKLFSVDCRNAVTGERYVPVDLDDARVLIRSGRDPSPTDPCFHQQMTYAVCSLVYASFRRALGRQLSWGFDREDGKDAAVLHIQPHALEEANAYYDKSAGALRFGYFEASAVLSDDGRTPPRGTVFTCLSHDIVTHEVTHALLDGLRAHFTFPSGPDVLAFHEGFADLVALFQRFSYQEVVKEALRQSRGNPRRPGLLSNIGRQFGNATGLNRALRTAFEEDDSGRPRRYDERLEVHTLGSVLVSAVWDAFCTVYERKTKRYLLLATGGTGELPPGELPEVLLGVLAEEASQLAGQFLSMCVRAIDYCPPVDLEFGEFLRAVITADFDLVPDDRWAYREAWVDAFRKRGIYPSGVRTLSEDALLWRPPEKHMEAVAELSFAKLQFSGDPSQPADAKELKRQARVLGTTVAHPEYLELFGLAAPGAPAARGSRLEAPCVESIRTARRVGPDGQVVYDQVAEVTQRRIVRDEHGAEFDFYGGATVILGPNGNIRYIIIKRVLNEERLERQRRFMGNSGQRFWVTAADGHRIPGSTFFRLLHTK